MTHPTNGQPAEQSRLVALGREVERTSRRVGELDTLVRQLAADITALTRHLGGGSPEPGEPGDPDGEKPEPSPAVRAWLLADDPERAAADLADLVGWLHRVYLRYHGATLPSCWLWHAGVIEELWWLRCAHTEAYHPSTGSWLRIGDWHDRQRPNTVKRIAAATRGCELDLHMPGAQNGHPPAEVPLAGAASAIATAWIATGRDQAPPEPTPAQRAEAAAYDRALHRSRR
jgi:hypothetical protein